MYMSVLFACVTVWQKRELDRCSCWELNSGPLEEQPMLFTSVPSLQPLNCLLNEGLPSLDWSTGSSVGRFLG